MDLLGAPLARPSGSWRSLALLAASVLLAASLIACGGGDTDDASEKVLTLEAKMHSLEESLEAIQDENAALIGELATLQEENTEQKATIAVLRQSQVDLLTAQQAAEAARESSEEVAEFQENQEEQLLTLFGEQARTEWRLDDLDSRLQGLEGVAAQVEMVLPTLEKWLKAMDERMKLLESSGVDSTLSLFAEGGGQAQVINYGTAYGGARSAVLVLPDPLPDGEIPLVVSLHGFGSDSFFQSLYVPLHDRVNTHGFALLLPNGTENADGQRFWNPTDGFGKADQDDTGALTALVQEAGGEFDMGPVYFFGYSNGGFMAYHMACKGLPGLRAVASLAGTSYYEDSSCEGAPPVSVLHIHGTDDSVILHEGAETVADAKGDGEPAFYAGAEDMVTRWARRADCDWPEDPEPYASLDFDQFVPGPEAGAFRVETGCAEGISIELWIGEGSGHTPGYGDAFTDALLEWLLAQE